ncbi:MAG: glycoside hydrolase family 3 C-terminal domain-containing protein, partial [Anaerolineales bacterium]|nr:glycoside hydrolase family 3 C-terminal domain-containing protein [Anaerolineales bacterium]
VGRAGVATVFPQAIGLAATWNPGLMHQVATVISDEARAKHHQAARQGLRQLYTGLTFWSPNVNIFRDPRWGRGQETYGEDPYLTAQMGIAFIKGLQGSDPNILKLIATPKHYAVHSGPESTRHHFDARVDERDMREFYLYAFEACVKEGKAASIMGAYNRVNGEPCCASQTLLERILREEWGFDGFVVSDCEAIRDIFENHKVTDTPAEAAAMAVKNGCELNCGNVYSFLLEAVEQGLIAETKIDRAVERLFTARFRLGMFDPPEQVPYTQIPYEVVDSQNHRELALQAARGSIVLLKNEHDLLPLDKEINSIAVIGPNADDLLALLGNYNGTPRIAVTPLEGIRRKVCPAMKLHYAQGCEITRGVPPMQVIPSTALYPADRETLDHGLNARYYANHNFDGQPGISKVDCEIDFIWKDTSPLTGKWGDHFSVRWEGFLVPPKSGTYRIGVNGFSQYRLYSDEKLIVDHNFIHHPILKTTEIALEAGCFYKLRLDFVNRGLDPQIQLLWAPPGIDYLSDALDAAAKAEVIIVVLGLSPYLESEEMQEVKVEVEGFSGGDRTEIKLPSTQLELLKKVQSLGKPVVLVLLNGGAIAVNWAAENIPAIVEAWYPGQAGGEAIADVLFGDYNPGGKLPVTFYKSVDDLPPFDDYQLEGHTYRYFQGEPLYPFGHGLSYTSFDYSNLFISREQVTWGERLDVSLTVSNTGSIAGEEVVQLYTRDEFSGTQRLLKALRGFAHVLLQPGESKTITFKLSADHFAFYDQELNLVLEPGRIHVLLGSSSTDIRLKSEFEIIGPYTMPVIERVFVCPIEVG